MNENKEQVAENEANYIDIKGMQARVDEQGREQAEAFHGHLRALSDQAQTERSEAAELFNKAMQSERNEAYARRADELEEEKVKAIKAVEDRYEKDNVKSSHTRVLDSAYAKLLGHEVGQNIDEPKYTSSLDKSYSNIIKNI